MAIHPKTATAWRSRPTRTARDRSAAPTAGWAVAILVEVGATMATGLGLPAGDALALARVGLVAVGRSHGRSAIAWPPDAAGAVAGFLWVSGLAVGFLWGWGLAVGFLQPSRQWRGSGPRSRTATSAPQRSHWMNSGRTRAFDDPLRRQSAQYEGTGPFGLTVTDASQRAHMMVSGRPTPPFYSQRVIWFHALSVCPRYLVRWRHVRIYRIHRPRGRRHPPRPG